MKPLIVLLIAFVLLILMTKLKAGGPDLILSGNVAMTVMLIFTSIGHFVFTKAMSMMLPSFIPAKTRIIYITGFVEIAAAIGLLIPRTRELTAWLLMVFFIVIMPANILAAIKGIDIEKGTIGAQALSYLWFRIPVQIFFISWTYWFSLSTWSRHYHHLLAPFH